MLCLSQYARRVIPLLAKPPTIPRISSLLRILPLSAASLAQSRWVPQTLTLLPSWLDRIRRRCYRSRRGFRPLAAFQLCQPWWLGIPANPNQSLAQVRTGPGVGGGKHDKKQTIARQTRSLQIEIPPGHKGVRLPARPTTTGSVNVQYPKEFSRRAVSASGVLEPAD